MFDQSNPYIRLFGAVIRQAIDDLGHKDPKIRTDAQSFLFGERLEAYCALCGLDAGYMRGKIAKKSKKIELLTKAVSNRG